MTSDTVAAPETGTPAPPATRLEELHQRRERALAPAPEPPPGVRRRTPARERVRTLLDDGTVREIGTLTGASTYDEHGRQTGFTPANVVVAQGRIEDRPAVVVADDFSVRGGSSEATSPEKWQFAERLSLERRVPLVRLVESAGGSVKLVEKMGATKLPGYAAWPLAQMLGTVPVVGVAMGPCAGLGAIRVAAAHFSVMIRERSQVFAAGPQVVGPGIGEDVDKEALGGAQVHARGSGLVDNEAVDEADALDQVRRFLGYLPSSVHELPPVLPATDPVDRTDEALRTAVPEGGRRVYKIRPILESLMDEGSVFEIGRYWGGGTVTVLGRLGGYPVGVMANDPRVGGGQMSDRSAQKITRFVDLCDTFNLPLLNLVDQPGVSVGSAAEARGTLRDATRAYLAIHQATVPWCTVVLRRVFGMAGMAHAPNDRAVMRYAWPTAHWGSIPVDGGVEAAHRREIRESPDPQARLDELLEYYRQFESPFRTAERFGIEEMIDPAETRPLLCEWAADAYRILPELLGPKARTMRV